MRKTFILIGFLLLLILVATILLVSRGGKPERIQPNKVVAIIPPKGSLLSSGQKLIFNVSFQNKFKITDLNIVITKKVRNETPQEIRLETTAGSNDTVLKITTKEDVEDLTEYHLVVSDKQGGLLLDISYRSQPALPTPAPSNNLQLKNFLPYQTATFSLEYLDTRNIYVFHLKPDFKSPDSPEVQFNKAQELAKEFIKNRGVDINSIVIEWRYY